MKELYGNVDLGIHFHRKQLFCMMCDVCLKEESTLIYVVIELHYVGVRVFVEKRKKIQCH